ncbi:hypothetical protein [Pseudactinotalea sp.]|uniref:hypothetical protein n=1 Tax=Pseudactinotalea sp. TaxID=1926260 RepID=UPI003B3B7663
MEPTYADPGTPPAREDRRRSVTAAFVQLASPFVFVGVLFFGLVVEIPVPVNRDPHGYGQIFGFLFSFLLMIPGIALPGIAIPLLRKARRGGAVLLIVASLMWVLLFLVLATGFPGGIAEIEWSRIVTMVVSVLWAFLCCVCAWVGFRAFGRFPPR